MTRFQMTGRTDVGKGRTRNEDSWAGRDDLGIVAVADGMGGHPAGDVASRLAVETVLRTLGGDEPTSDSATAPRKPENAGERMVDAVRSANQRILEEGERHPERKGMGTTLTVLWLDSDGEVYRVGHVGDSRAYLLRGGSLEPLTRDDTPLQREVDAGKLSREEARVHPLSHVLSQALGTTNEVDPQVVEGRVRSGDLFLVCSDGLTAVLSEERIRELMEEKREAPLEELAKGLVQETLDAGAPDNVTVALVRAGETD